MGTFFAMGAFLDKPITDKECHVGEAEDLEWACAHMQGWRVSMEDAHQAKTGMAGAPDCSFFGVFDGHGGSMVAQYSAEKFIDYVTKQEAWSCEKKGAEGAENLRKCLTAAALDLDASMRELPQVRDGTDHSGTTAVFGLITATHIIVGNIG